MMMMAKRFMTLAFGAALAAGSISCRSMDDGMRSDSMKPQMMQESQVRMMVDGWPSTAQSAARAAMEKYGMPDEATPTRLIWHDSGPWKRSIVYREEVQHDFPMPHKDVWEQFIDYSVPADKFDELAMYDGSVIVERTKGEMSARCDKEGANFLAINLANDIVTGRRTVEEARRMYAETMMQVMKGSMPEYTRGFAFTLPRGNTGYADRPAPSMQ